MLLHNTKNTDAIHPRIRFPVYTVQSASHNMSFITIGSEKKIFAIALYKNKPLTVKSRSYVFQSSMGKKRMILEHVTQWHIFLIEDHVSIHRQKRVSFLCFESYSRALHFLANRSIFMVGPKHLRCCFNHENIFTSESVCFAPWAFFISQSEMTGIDSAAFLFSTTFLTVYGQNQTSFTMLACFCFGSGSTAAKSQVPHVLIMTYASSWPWFQVIQNCKAAEAPKASGAVELMQSRR